MSSKQPIKIRISAPGKVILHGEHSVVYGKLAVAASLGLRTKIEFEENVKNDQFISVDFLDMQLSTKIPLEDCQNLLNKPIPVTTAPSNYNLSTSELLNHDEIVKYLHSFVSKFDTNSFDIKQQQAMISLFYLFWGILGIFDFDILPFSIQIQTDLTVSAGTGSSASFAVTLAALFFQLIRLKSPKIKEIYKTFTATNLNLQNFDKSELTLISQWAYQSERIIHGTPSGVDNTICTFGGLVEFRKGTNPQLVKLSTKFKTILINTKVSRDTKRLVQLAASKCQKYPKLFENILDSMDHIANEALDVIKQMNQGDFSRNYEDLGELADMNQNLLRCLGVSHTKLDEICFFLTENGLHGKLTGAGGGGYAICLVPPSVGDDVIRSVIDGLEMRGFGVVLTDLGGCGVTIDQI